jgi:dTDP-4-dehydrorhamnose 3,5-epimerase
VSHPGTVIPEIMIFEPTVFRDERGFFMETYNRRDAEKAGLYCEFVQENHSQSLRNVLRGLHYQVKHPQGKLVRVVSGAVWDVAVDLRKSSPTFGRWFAIELSEDNKKCVWIPEGFAHGFLTLSEKADLIYKVTDFYSPQDERTIAWNDSQLAIDWPNAGAVILSEKDRQGMAFREAELFE